MRVRFSLLALMTTSKDKVMSTKAAEKKSLQLGMPVGTASAKLRKSILFSLLKEAGKNVCFQCEKTIDSEEELSVEHKVPWLDSSNPKELFFSLDNIAFSHLRCNVGAARHPQNVKQIQQEIAKKGLHPLCKLKEEDVLQIKELSKAMKGSEIAKLLKVSKHTVYRILNNKTFSYIK